MSRDCDVTYQVTSRVIRRIYWVYCSLQHNGIGHETAAVYVVTSTAPQRDPAEASGRLRALAVYPDQSADIFSFVAAEIVAAKPAASLVDF